MLLVGLSSSNRTFSLRATSFGASLAFQGNQNDWHFEEVFACKPRSVPDPGLGQEPNLSVCSEAFYHVEQYSDFTTSWLEGDEVEISQRSSGDLQILVRSSERNQQAIGSLLVIPFDVWQGHGAFVFQAELTVGGKMGTGSRDYLIDGYWEALQSSFWTSFLRDTTEVVKVGNLLTGASVDFVSPESAVVSYGHLTPLASKDELGFRVSALTEEADVSLRARYFGLAKPSTFKPDWVDEVSSSSILVAFLGVLSLLAVLIELGGALHVHFLRHSAGNQKNID
jgi:hypothetical protein